MPEVILQLTDKRAKASSNPGCCYSIELYFLNIRTREEALAGL